ncbi:highly immunogenic outer capsid protein [Aeromonas phage avDM6]|nr:highly immunogenic outer capsid protein [Aeromonas phage avDM6]
MAYVYIVKGKSTTLTSTVTGGTSEGYTFVWKKDSSVISGSGKTKTLNNFTDTDVGVYTVTASKAEEDDVIDTFELGCVEHIPEVIDPVPVVNKVVGDSALFVVTKGEIKYTPVTTDPSITDMFDVSTQWVRGVENIDGETSLGYTHLVDISDDGVIFGVSQSFLKESVVQSSTTFDVGELSVTEAVELVAEWAVVPLSYRNASFTWIGYWVIDEIKAKSDWFDDYSTMKYKKEVETIVKAFNDYGEVFLLESRNGRLLKVSDLK